VDVPRDAPDFRSKLLGDRGWSLSSNGGFSALLATPITNALDESLLLHMRILVELLISKSSETDNIRLTELWPNPPEPIARQLQI
jgi:hypothetical protein